MLPEPTPMGRVLVTGGASGLGAAVAGAVAAAGGTPIVVDLDISRVPEGTAAHQADVSDTEALEALIARIAEEHGGLDAVVTAAGIDRPGTIDDVSREQWEKIVGVNLLGTAATVRAAFPHLKASHGRVVTIASSLALRPLSDATAYSASKFAVLGFTRALALETKGIMGVTCVIPAGMDTRFFDGRTEQYKPGADAQLIDPAGVANAIVFALGQPRGYEIRELIMTPEEEPSWP